MKQISTFSAQHTAKKRRRELIFNIIAITLLVALAIFIVYSLVDGVIQQNFGKKLATFKKEIAKQTYRDNITNGLINTAKISVIGLIIGIVLGTLIAIAEVMPKYSLLPRIISKISTGYVAFFRGTPIVVQLLLSYYVIMPIFGLKAPALTAAIAIYGLNSAAYCSEIMRSGILSVDPGQLEAGRALGLPYPIAMIKIVIPQAFKNILPTLGNEFITLIKETSVVSMVGALDLFKAFKEIGANTYEYMMPYLAVSLIYLIVIVILTCLLKLFERWLRKGDRRN